MDSNLLPKLLYFTDPLCGWCYGFSPVIKQIKADYEGQLTVEAIGGGLAIGDRAKPVKEAFAYIRDATKVVENRTGVIFGQPFLKNVLDEGDYVYNSEPPCTALTVFKSLLPAKGVEFLHDMQLAFFRDGKSLNDEATYLALTKPYDIDESVFIERFRAGEYKAATYKEFEKAKQFGATGFPTLKAHKNNQYYLISRGYLPYASLGAMVDKLLTL